jgi:RNA polymerase sigma-70 factor (ECF subfamily)
MRAASEDLNLVARCKRELPHYHGAFEELVASYRNSIYTLCYRMTGNRQDAEDLLQEILLRLFLGIQSFDGSAAFSTWVYRVAQNHCLNFLAKHKPQRAQTEVLLEEPPDPRSEEHKSHGLAQHILNQMEATNRSLLVMKYIMELDIGEISGALGIGISALKMRLLRARAQFRKLYLEAR